MGHFRRERDDQGKVRLRLVAFLKLTVIKGTHVTRARQFFRRDRPTEQEAQVMALSRQSLLSTAELIKCTEVGARDISTDDKLMDTLYDDDYTTSDNIACMMLTAKNRESVTMAIANLYLRKQIIFKRVSFICKLKFQPKSGRQEVSFANKFPALSHARAASRHESYSQDGHSPHLPRPESGTVLWKMSCGRCNRGTTSRRCRSSLSPGNVKRLTDSLFLFRQNEI